MQDQLGLLVILAYQVIRDLKVPLELLVLQDQKVLLAKPVVLDNLARQGRLETRDRQDLKEQLV